MLPIKKLPTSISQEEQLLAASLALELEVEETTATLFNKSILRKLLNCKLDKPKEFIKITGGYSNETYQINGLVLRFPKLTNPLVRNQSIEVHNLLLARALELSPLEPVAYYSKHNLLVTRFIPHCQPLTQAEFKNSEKINAVAKLVKKLHYYSDQFKKNPETPLSFVDDRSKSFARIKTILSLDDETILEKITKIRGILASFNVLERPSHGDLHHSNLVEINGNVQLIDWEVSSVEDPAYDIARLFCVSDLNEENRTIFLDCYQQSGEITLSENEIASLRQRIQLFEPINYFSIVLWAKFELKFSDGDKKKLLEKAVFIHREKTLVALDRLNLDQREDKNENKTFVDSHTTFFPAFETQEANTPFEGSSLETKYYSHT